MDYWTVLDSRYLDRPTDWDSFFGRKAPLMLEIGFGNGDHLVHLAQKYPDFNVLGCEISRPSLKKAGGKVKNRQVTNCRVLDGGGPSLLWLNIPTVSLDQLHINFPDPWHKEGHNKRRLINDDFLELAASRMKEGGLLFVATDHPDYQPVVTECLERTPYFDSRLETTYVASDPDRFRTKYELKAVKEGRTSQYYKFIRNATATTKPYAIPEDYPMPHAVVSLPMTIDEVAARFEPFDSADKANQRNVRYLQTFRALGGPAMLVETYISQQPQHQRLGLNIIQRGEGEFIIQMHEIGFPRATQGVHFAVKNLADWLVSLHPNGSIIRHNLA